MLKFKLADSSDVKRIVDLLESARQHKIDSGEPPPWSTVRHERVQSGIEAQQVYVVMDDTELAGTIQIQNTDEEVWGIDETPALYLHRLAVDPGMQGKGIGGEIIAWASNEAANIDVQFVRLDAFVGATSLRGWYEKRGFESCGQVHPPAYRRPSMRYQKRLQ